MNLVDLNRRQDEPEVLSVLRLSHGSEAALDEALTRYRSGEWPFLGWQDGDEVVACAGAEDYDVDTIAIRSIAVVPNSRDRGLARALIDALAARMGAERDVTKIEEVELP